MKNIFTIAVVGNPNVGKTALINMLSGSHLKLGNWPGVTVEKKETSLFYKGFNIKLIDLPGVYGLGSLTQDEIITSNYLFTKNYDMIINVIDAHNLQLNMYLTSQLLELKKPTLVAINFYNEFKKNGNIFIFEEFTKKLNIDALPIEANQAKEKINLLDACISLLKSHKIPKPFEKLRSNQGRQEVVKMYLHKILQLKHKTYTTITDKLDKIFLHPILGLFSFFAIFCQLENKIVHENSIKLCMDGEKKLFFFTPVFKPVTFTFDDKCMTVMNESVNNSSCQCFINKYFIPTCKFTV